MKLAHILIFVLLGTVIFSCEEEGPKPSKVDICVYGGTSAGVMAAYSAAKMGKNVLLIEPGRHLGGLTSGGLGATDIGNKYAITGLAREFYRKIGQKQEKLASSFAASFLQESEARERSLAETIENRIKVTK